jgi:hypothetical protein
MEYVEAIATLIVIFVVPAVIICGLVGAPAPDRRPAGRNGGANPPAPRA